MAAYPSIPIAVDSFMELPRAYQVVRTSYEAGYAQTRVKSTTAPRQFAFQHDGVPAADRTTFLSFWEARKGGAESFDFTHPITAEVISCRFKHDASNPPPIKLVGSVATAIYVIGPITIEEAL